MSSINDTSNQVLRQGTLFRRRRDYFRLRIIKTENGDVKV